MSTGAEMKILRVAGWGTNMISESPRDATLVTGLVLRRRLSVGFAGLSELTMRLFFGKNCESVCDNSTTLVPGSKSYARIAVSSGLVSSSLINSSIITIFCGGAVT